MPTRKAKPKHNPRTDAAPPVEVPTTSNTPAPRQAMPVEYLRRHVPTLRALIDSGDPASRDKALRILFSLTDDELVAVAETGSIPEPIGPDLQRRLELAFAADRAPTLREPIPLIEGQEGELAE